MTLADLLGEVLDQLPLAYMLEITTSRGTTYHRAHSPPAGEPDLDEGDRDSPHHGWVVPGCKESGVH